MKNWSAKDKLEMLGIAGIIFSLIFVGIELNQSSTVARLEAHQSFTESMAEIINNMALDPGISAIAIKSQTAEGISQLTTIESSQIAGVYLSVLYLWYGLFQSVEEGVLSEEYLEITASGPMFTSPFLKVIWPTYQVQFDQNFVDFIESLPWNN